SASPSALYDGSLAAGPSEAQLRAAFPGRNLQRLDPESFQALTQSYAGQGRFLSGIELAAVLGAHTTSASPAPSSLSPQPSPPAPSTPSPQSSPASAPSVPSTQ